MVDIETLMDRVEGDRKLLGEMVSVFLQDSAGSMESVLNALESRDLHGLAAAAHALRGSVANFAVRGAFETARNLETLAREGNLESAREQYTQLSRQVVQLREELTALIHS